MWDVGEVRTGDLVTIKVHFNDRALLWRTNNVASFEVSSAAVHCDDVLLVLAVRPTIRDGVPVLRAESHVLLLAPSGHVGWWKMSGVVKR